MHFKLIIVLSDDSITDRIVDAARERGATGSTIITSARGEGLKAKKTFFGLDLETQRDVVLLLVEEHLSREILEAVAEAGQFDDSPGTGIAFSIDVDDAVGVRHQVRELTEIVENEL